MNNGLFMLASADEAWVASSIGLLLFAGGVALAMIGITISLINRWWQMNVMICCIWVAIGLMVEPWTLFLKSGKVEEAASYWNAAALVWCIVFAISLLALCISSASSGKHRYRHRRRRSSRQQPPAPSQHDSGAGME